MPRRRLYFTRAEEAIHCPHLLRCRATRERAAHPTRRTPVPDEETRPVMLRHNERLVPASLAFVAEAAREAASDLPGAAIELARMWGDRLPLPGHGSTPLLWEALASVAAGDLSVARATEPHLDALAILAESGAPPPPAGSSWGVFAAEGPGVRAGRHPLRRRLGARRHQAVVLPGRRASHALVTAYVDDDPPRLFAVDLRQRRRPRPGTPGTPRGLRDITTAPVRFDGVPATAVGEPGWYLRPRLRVGRHRRGRGLVRRRRRRRPAAACRRPRDRPPDQVAHLHLGAVDVRAHRRAAHPARRRAPIDAGAADGEAGRPARARVRKVVADPPSACCTTRPRARPGTAGARAGARRARRGPAPLRAPAPRRAGRRRPRAAVLATCPTDGAPW